MSFLILGAPDCKFCKFAKLLVSDYEMTYDYLDLTEVYPGNWRNVFMDLADYIKGQTSIPLIFKSNDAPVSQPLREHVMKLEFVGGFQELQELLDNDDFDLSGTY